MEKRKEGQKNLHGGGLSGQFNFSHFTDTTVNLQNRPPLEDSSCLWENNEEDTACVQRMLPLKIEFSVNPYSAYIKSYFCRLVSSKDKLHFHHTLCWSVVLLPEASFDIKYNNQLSRLDNMFHIATKSTYARPGKT